MRLKINFLLQKESLIENTRLQTYTLLDISIWRSNMNNLNKVAQKYLWVQRLIFLIIGRDKKTDNHEKADKAIYNLSMSISAQIIKGKK